jgi:hypothetical protein
LILFVAKNLRLKGETLADSETEKQDQILKSMKIRKEEFEKRYPGRGEEVMYAYCYKNGRRK